MGLLMATDQRLIDANDLWSDIMMLPHNGDMISSEEVEQAIKDAPHRGCRGSGAVPGL